MKMIANHATNMIDIECKEIHGTYNTCLDPLSTLYDDKIIQLRSQDCFPL
jgi:hypothetical protein